MQTLHNPQTGLNMAYRSGFCCPVIGQERSKRAKNLPKALAGKSRVAYVIFLAEVERLTTLDLGPESIQGLRLELLAKLVEDYEKTRFAFAKPDPIDAILFRMEQQGLKQKDIVPYLGGKNRASEVLSRKRSLTLPMIRALYEELDIPPGLLIREPCAEYSTAKSARVPAKKARRKVIRSMPRKSR